MLTLNNEDANTQNTHTIMFMQYISAHVCVCCGLDEHEDGETEIFTCTLCMCACGFVRQRVDNQMDDWEKQRLKVDSSNTTLGGETERERKKEERMDGGKQRGDRVEGHKGREGPEHADREGVLKRRWEIVTFISFSTLRQQMIGWLTHFVTGSKHGTQRGTRGVIKLWFSSVL